VGGSWRISVRKSERQGLLCQDLFSARVRQVGAPGAPAVPAPAQSFCLSDGIPGVSTLSPRGSDSPGLVFGRVPSTVTTVTLDLSDGAPRTLQTTAIPSASSAFFAATVTGTVAGVYEGSSTDGVSLLQSHYLHTCPGRDGDSDATTVPC